MNSIVACLLLLAACSEDPFALSAVYGDVRQAKFDGLEWFGLQLAMPALDLSHGWRIHQKLDIGMIDAEKGDRNALNVMLGPVLQWHWPGERASLIIESGLRPTYVARTFFNDRSIGGSFHFASHVGATLRLRQLPLQANVRFLHISNAGTRSDNPGLNYALFSVGYYWYPRAELRSGAGGD